jgi:hypothetical protein
MEVIIAIVLLGGVFLILAGALVTVARGTETNEKVQSIDTALITYGEILQTAVPYSACTANNVPLADTYFFAADPFMTGSNSVSPLWRRPNNVIVEVVSVGSWNATTKAWGTSCIFPDSGAQKVKYRVTACSSVGTSPCTNPTVRTGEVVKRKAGPS